MSFSAPANVKPTAKLYGINRPTCRARGGTFYQTFGYITRCASWLFLLLPLVVESGGWSDVNSLSEAISAQFGAVEPTKPVPVPQLNPPGCCFNVTDEIQYSMLVSPDACSYTGTAFNGNSTEYGLHHNMVVGSDGNLLQVELTDAQDRVNFLPQGPPYQTIGIRLYVKSLNRNFNLEGEVWPNKTRSATCWSKPGSRPFVPTRICFGIPGESNNSTFLENVTIGGVQMQKFNVTVADSSQLITVNMASSCTIVSVENRELDRLEFSGITSFYDVGPAKPRADTFQIPNECYKANGDFWEASELHVDDLAMIGENPNQSRFPWDA